MKHPNEFFYGERFFFIIVSPFLNNIGNSTVDQSASFPRYRSIGFTPTMKGVKAHSHRLRHNRVDQFSIAYQSYINLPHILEEVYDWSTLGETVVKLHGLQIIPDLQRSNKQLLIIHINYIYLKF